MGLDFYQRKAIAAKEIRTMALAGGIQKESLYLQIIERWGFNSKFVDKILEDLEKTDYIDIALNGLIISNVAKPPRPSRLSKNDNEPTDTDPNEPRNDGFN